jgi:uncharacterized protein YcnI
VGVALTLIVPAIAIAHAVVYPKTSAPGAYERYVLRVPNERDVATTRVELRFPSDMRVVSFADVPGWELQIQTDSAKRIVGAVWTGTLAPARFIEFPFVAVNPNTTTRITWPAFQTYANGDRVEWTGAEGAKSPASTTTIAGAAEPASRRGIPWVASAALLISLISLGLSLRKHDTSRTGSTGPWRIRGTS